MKILRITEIDIAQSKRDKEILKIINERRKLIQKNIDRFKDKIPNTELYQFYSRINELKELKQKINQNE